MHDPIVNDPIVHDAIVAAITTVIGAGVAWITRRLEKKSLRKKGKLKD